jgi:hypothetical protein
MADRKSSKPKSEPQVFRSIQEIRRRFLPGTVVDGADDADTPSLGVTGALTQEAFQRAHANFSRDHIRR